jgi:uncharacterized damage-inducible protein DinB
MKNILLNLLAYEHWANLRIIEALETTENAPPKAVALMAHILAAQHVWFTRLTNIPETGAVWPDTPVSELRTMAEEQYQRFLNWLINKPGEELIDVLSYYNSRGEGPFQNTIQDILLHLSHHAPYHRGQIIQLLKTVREDVPATDFIVWKREGQ